MTKVINRAAIGISQEFDSSPLLHALHFCEITGLKAPTLRRFVEFGYVTPLYLGGSNKREMYFGPRDVKLVKMMLKLSGKELSLSKAHGKALKKLEKERSWPRRARQRRPTVSSK